MIKNAETKIQQSMNAINPKARSGHCNGSLMSVLWQIQCASKVVSFTITVIHVPIS